MKILAFTDIHGSMQALNRIGQKAKSNNPNLLVCAGDISIFEHRIAGIIRKLNSLNKKIVIVNGNHENASAFIRHSKGCKNIIFIHKSHAFVEGALFLGYGGGGFSDMDKGFENTAVTNFKNAAKHGMGVKTILVTHAPPYKTKLDMLAGGHFGNKSIRRFIEKNKVDLLICGHLHENFGKEDRIGNTLVVNPGPFGKILTL